MVHAREQIHPVATGTETGSAAPAGLGVGDRPIRRVALVHDWLVGLRGGELVLDRLARLFVGAGRDVRLYTMFGDGRPLTKAIDGLPTYVARLGRLPGASGRLRRWLLPLYPLAVVDLSRRIAADHAEHPFDLVLSTSSAAVKGVRPPRRVPHVCYCHTPARYLWSREAEYAKGSRLRGLGLRLFGASLRDWDRRTAANVTRFVANSMHTASEIHRCYGRDASVIHPPVDTEFFAPPSDGRREAFWLAVSALEPYKRIDLAIEAANLTKRRLIVAGVGSEEARLRAMAGPTVEFVGRVSNERLRQLYQTAEVLMFPQVEDFGIVAVEAQACGCAVAARRAGGALDSVIEGVTGSFFDEPEPEALALAAERAAGLSGARCRTNAERFAGTVFDSAMQRIIGL